MNWPIRIYVAIMLVTIIAATALSMTKAKPDCNAHPCGIWITGGDR